MAKEKDKTISKTEPPLGTAYRNAARILNRARIEFRDAWEQLSRAARIDVASYPENLLDMIDLVARNGKFFPERSEAAKDIEKSDNYVRCSRAASRLKGFFAEANNTDRQQGFPANASFVVAVVSLYPKTRRASDINNLRILGREYENATAAIYGAVMETANYLLEQSVYLPVTFEDYVSQSPEFRNPRFVTSGKLGVRRKKVKRLLTAFSGLRLYVPGG